MPNSDEIEWPALGDARPGARFVLGVSHPGADPPSRSGLPPDFVYAIGTVGALAGTPAMPYLITAGHVVNRAYGASGFPSIGTPMMIGFYGNQVRPWTPGSPWNLRPSSPWRDDGALIDAVAIPLPPDLMPASRFPVVIDDPLELDWCLDHDAFVLVQRNGRPQSLNGVIKQIESSDPDAAGVRRAKRIVLRFNGRTSEDGDSGAPVLALDDKAQLHLLGFHYLESGIDPHLKVNTVSTATAASAVCDHIGLSIL